MKNVRTMIFLACAVVLSVGLYAADKTTTWEGTLVDSSCYLKNNTLTGNDHMGMKDCGAACLKSGLPAGLLGPDKSYHALIAPSPLLASYVGQRVRVSGSAHTGVIVAEKVEVRKEGKWEEVKLNSMM